MYICILNISTIKRDSLQCIPIFNIQNCNFSISIGHFRVPKTLNIIIIQSNLFLWTLLYDGQLVWSQKSQKPCNPYLYNIDTSVKRTLGSVPLKSVLKRFHIIISNVHFHSKITPRSSSRQNYYII